MPQSATARRGSPEKERQREKEREQRAAQGEAASRPSILRRARERQREHQLQALVVDLAQHARGDLRGDEEHGAGTQQRRDDRELQLAAFGERHLRQKSGEAER